LTRLLWKFVMNSPFKPYGERHHHQCFLILIFWGQFCDVAKSAIIHRKISPFFATS
jgi:hypothetical protein